MDGGAQKAPFPPGNDETAEARKVLSFHASTAVGRGSALGENRLAHFLKVIQVRPTGRELDHHSTCRFEHVSGHFDQACTPRTRLALTQRVVLAPTIVPLTAATTSQRFDRHVLFR